MLFLFVLHHVYIFCCLQHFSPGVFYCVFTFCMYFSICNISPLYVHFSESLCLHSFMFTVLQFCLKVVFNTVEVIITPLITADSFIYSVTDDIALIPLFFLIPELFSSFKQPPPVSLNSITVTAWPAAG